jgi:hypothetical protein
LPDGAAFDAFFRENFARIVRASALVTLDVSVAEDIAAEAFARLWGKWGQIDNDDHAGGFVFKTAMRLCYRELSMRRRRVQRMESGEDQDPARPFMQPELVRALKDLPTRQRQCMVLRDWGRLRDGRGGPALGRQGEHGARPPDARTGAVAGGASRGRREPQLNTDIRDDELRTLLDRATSRIETDPERRLRYIRRSGSTRRAVRLTAIGASLALFLGALGWAAIELKGAGSVLVGGRKGPVSLDESSWAGYRKPDQNWTLRFPPQWYLQPFEVSCLHWGGQGAIVTNVAHEFKQVKGSNFCTSEWDMRGLPSTLVVVEVGRFGGGPYLPPGCCGRTIPPDTPLPLTLDSAQTVTTKPGVEDPLDPYGAPQPHFVIPVVFQGSDYDVTVWIGHATSGVDREIARRIVASIEFGHQDNPFPSGGPSQSP